ncbi:hypothetical protein HZA97_00185 [Candidatus Woesearchaeota archaeon]|nr:hypothetical protein [Candidatus Woesearchaeota archaeon]
MKKYALIIFAIVIVVSVVGILLNANLTGQSYRYAQNFGPQGQQPSHVSDQFFGIENWNQKVPFPSVKEYPTPSSKAACCSFVKMAEMGAKSCSMDVESFEYSCSDEEGSFVMPPCPPEYVLCNFPR